MSRIGLVGGSYTSQSRNADDQLSMNLYPEVIESGAGKVASALYCTPGTKVFVTLPDSPIRGEFYTATRAFAVAGSSFFEIFSNGTYVKYGMLVNDGQVVSMAAGPTQLLIASSGIAYVFDFSTGVITSSTLNAGGSLGIADSSLNTGGAGYTDGDTFIVQTGNGDATGVVDSVSSGVVLTYHLTSVGSGYLVSSGVSTIPTTGGGSGLEINILALGGGYAVGDTGTVNGGSVAATYAIDSVDANGNVLTYTVASGSGYSPITNQTTSTGGMQPGIGVGFTLNISAVGAANTFTALPASTLQNVSKVGFCDGFFLATLIGSETFLASNLEDATAWNPLSRATISVFVDNVLSMIVDHRNVILFGIKKTAIYYDSGNFPFPFDLVPGGFIEQGIGAPDSPVSLDNSVFWIGGDERGAGIAWRANGYTPVRISTHAVEFAWQSYATIADAVGYSYQDQGHSFWVVYFPTANKTWVYDAATNLWHERGFWNEATGTYSAHLSQNHIFAFGKHLVGDWNSGNIYEMSIDYLSDQQAPTDATNIQMSAYSSSLSALYFDTPTSILGNTYQFGLLLVNNGAAAIDVFYGLTVSVTTVSVPAGGFLNLQATAIGDGVHKMRLEIGTNATDAALNVTAFAPYIFNANTFQQLIPAANQNFSGWIAVFGGFVLTQNQSRPGLSATPAPILRKRRAPHVSTEQEWIFHHKLQVDMETGLGPIPPLFQSSSSPASIVLADSGNNLWAVTMLDAGELQQNPATSGSAVTWFMNDSVLANTSWQIKISTLGILQQVSVTYNSAYPLVTEFASTPSGYQSRVMVLSGILYNTTPIPIPRDPIINLRWSDDGGHTWSNYYPVGVGQAGDFKTRAIWRRLGRSRDRVYELSMSDPIPWRLLEDDLKASPGFQTSERIVSQYRKVS